MAGFRPMIIGAVLTALFAVCLFTFMVTFTQSNNPTSPLLTDQNFSSITNSVNSMNNSLTSFGTTTNNAISTLNGSSPSLAFLFLIFNGAFTIPLSFLATGANLFGNLTSLASIQLLGSPFAIVFSILMSILLVTLVLLIIKFIRTGEEER